MARAFGLRARIIVVAVVSSGWATGCRNELSVGQEEGFGPERVKMEPTPSSVDKAWRKQPRFQPLRKQIYEVLVTLSQRLGGPPSLKYSGSLASRNSGLS